MPNSQRGSMAAFTSVTTLFFAWGFITSMIDPLIPSVRGIFSLSLAESMLTQFAFFMAYGVVSLPAAALVARTGYGRSILIALAAMVAGCLVIPLATHLRTYELVLVALFIIASGITVLQVAANPLAAALGPPDRSHFRLTFSQAFNSLGTVIGPYLGATVMLRGGVFGGDGTADAAAQQGESLRNIDTSFLIIVALIVLLGVLMFRFRARLDGAAPPPATGSTVSPLTALRSRWAVLGAAAIFLYVGAEVSIGSMMTNFLHGSDVLGVSIDRAGQLVSLYWLGAMVGRFIGSALLTRIPAARLLAIAAGVAALLCLTVSQVGGELAAGAALSIGLFNSIMFPVIFTVTLERSTASSAATSGLLCMAIVGGAILPVLSGLIGDTAGLHTAFLLPMAAYACISFIAMAAAKARVVASGGSPEMAH
jgi:FHS family L-fucose permease-like MFS transporter